MNGISIFYITYVSVSLPSPLVQSQMCMVEFGFPAFKAQAVAMRPLTTVAGIPFMYSWSPLQHNFMVRISVFSTSQASVRWPSAHALRQ